MTSQRGTVTGIDKRTSTITVAFDDGDTPLVLTGEQIDAQRLDHAYATTVHRAQGATVDRAHVYLDGGGRELTYVALSRARDTTTIHCVADNLDQAADDLHRDWNHDRRQRWTLDTDLPAAPGQATRPSLLPSVDVGLRLGRLRAERTAILAAMPADPGPELADLRARQQALENQLGELRAGTGRYAGTDTGQVAATYRDIQARLDDTSRSANSPALSRRQRRRHSHLADGLQAELEQVGQHWHEIVQPIEHRLIAEIDALDQQTGQLGTSRHQRAFWRLEHPTAMDRLAALDRQIAALDRQIAALENHADLSSLDQDVLRRQPPGRQPPGLAQ